MKQLLMLFFICISFNLYSQIIDTFYDFKPCFNSKNLLCSLNKHNPDLIAKKGISYTLNYDSSFAYVEG